MRWRLIAGLHTVPAVKLEGDEEGIAALKAMAERSKDDLKFLIGEAQTNTDHRAKFRGEDGRPWMLRVDPVTGALVVEKIES